MTTAVRDLVDELDVLDLTGLAEMGAPCVSVYLPAGRTNQDARRAPLELRALLDQAREQLQGRLQNATDDDTAERVLGGLRRLLDDQAFWNYQNEG